MTSTNTRSADIGSDEIWSRSPMRPLTEYYFMKRAINHWNPPKHPSYNLIDARLESFKEAKEDTITRIIERSRLLLHRYVHFLQHLNNSFFVFKFHFTYTQKFCHYRWK